MSLVKRVLRNMGLYTALAGSTLVGCTDSSSEKADLEKLKQDLAKAKTSEVAKPSTSTYVPSVPSTTTGTVTSPTSGTTGPSTQTTATQPSVPSAPTTTPSGPTAPVKPEPVKPPTPSGPSVTEPGETKPSRGTFRTSRRRFAQRASDREKLPGQISYIGVNRNIGVGLDFSEDALAAGLTAAYDLRLFPSLRFDVAGIYNKGVHQREGDDLESQLFSGVANLEYILADSQNGYLGIGPSFKFIGSKFKNVRGFEPESTLAPMIGGRVRFLLGDLEGFGMALKSTGARYKNQIMDGEQDILEVLGGLKYRAGKHVAVGADGAFRKQEDEDVTRFTTLNGALFAELTDLIGNGSAIVPRVTYVDVDTINGLRQQKVGAGASVTLPLFDKLYLTASGDVRYTFRGVGKNDSDWSAGVFLTYQFK